MAFLAHHHHHLTDKDLLPRGHSLLLVHVSYGMVVNHFEDQPRRTHTQTLLPYYHTKTLADERNANNKIMILNEPTSLCFKVNSDSTFAPKLYIRKYQANVPGDT